MPFFHTLWIITGSQYLTVSSLVSPSCTLHKRHCLSGRFYLQNKFWISCLFREETRIRYPVISIRYEKNMLAGSNTKASSFIFQPLYCLLRRKCPFHIGKPVKPCKKSLIRLFCMAVLPRPGSQAQFCFLSYSAGFLSFYRNFLCCIMQMRPAKFASDTSPVLAGEIGRPQLPVPSGAWLKSSWQSEGMISFKVCSIFKWTDCFIISSLLSVILWTQLSEHLSTAGTAMPYAIEAMVLPYSFPHTLLTTWYHIQLYRLRPAYFHTIIIAQTFPQLHKLFPDRKPELPPDPEVL